MKFPNLGIKIREERIKRGITQQQLAEMVDISTNFMSLIENGRNMSVETLIKIADALSVSVDYLLSDTINLSGDNISAQIGYNLSSLSDDEKLFFLNMIKQYKNIER
ncbi:MAG: helix-turn-helix domain-containing protein [Ruminococcus sp.]